MNIEFIKWMCEKADGFEWVVNSLCPNGGIQLPDKSVLDISVIGDPKWASEWENIYNPLLLQKAIEGVNREGKSFLIKQDYSEIYIMPVNPTSPGYLNFYHSGYQNNYDTPDQAKEAALLYIYEQETNQ